MNKTSIQTWVAALTVAVVTVVGFAMAPPANAAADVTVNRIAGQDRYETAVAVAEAAYPTGARRVLVANGRKFPDALAGAALAGAVDGPLLLTERDTLPTATSNGIGDLVPTTVYILGGTDSVSTEVENSLAAPGRQVIRIAGDDRYETAAKIGSTVGADRVASLGGKRTAIVATGLAFADALAGGPIAAAGDGTGVHPILLVDAGVPAATEAAITELDIGQVVILGGTDAVPATVETRLETLTGSDAVRIAGGDRYATAVAIADAAVERFGFTVEDVLLANGRKFPDALAGGPLGGVRQDPILLTEATTLPAATSAFLEAEAAVVETITVLGGTAAVSDQVAKAAETAAESAARPSNETIAVDPLTREEQASGTTREYTATGLGTTPVDIVLVGCGDVSLSNGETRFANTNVNTIADGTALAGSAPDLAAVANARISAVNGTARQALEPNDDYANNVTPANGTVTFVVEGPAEGSTSAVCVVPVVFVDANVDNALNGTAANPMEPSEAFGTGGATTFSATGAVAGQFGAHTVESTEKGSDRFTACVPGATALSPEECVTFRYDSSDVFQLDSATITLPEFESRLSAGDSVRGTYNPDPAGQSTFNLTDAAPAPPTEPSAAMSGTAVEVSFTDSATPTVDLYRLYRAAGAATCPDFNTAAGRSAYTAVPAQASTVEGEPDQGETADTGNATPLPLPPAPTYTIADRTAQASATACYVVVAVDRESATDAGDESAGTTPVRATTT